MSFATAATLAFVIAYFVGSLPFGVIIARCLAGVDIRKHGSGNIGATNVGRVLGMKLGVLVLGLDCLKGALPTLFLPRILAGSDQIVGQHLAVLSGVAAILGHMFPCWLNFRGGKGVATALGVVLVLAPVVTAGALLVFVISFGLTRIVSLSSVVAACAFCGIQIALLLPSPFSEPTWSLAAFSAAVPLLIIVRHRANLARLFRGEEPRFQFRKVREPEEREPRG